MKNSFEQALLQAVALLRELPRQRGSVEDARARFLRFRSSHAEVDCSLLVDRPPGAEEVSFDILLGSPGGGTVALSWRPDDGTPWTVQHSDHWAANYVLTVNGRHTSIQSALIYLSTVLNRKPPLMEDLVNRLLIQEEIDASQPAASKREIQNAVDDFRMGQGLYSAAATRQWLQDMNLTMEALRELVAYNVRRRKLKKRITKGMIRPYFESHRKEFEILTVFRVQALSRAAAASLARAARSSGLWSAMNRSRQISQLQGASGQLATLRARELPSQIADASKGAIIGPERSSEGYWVGELLERKAARLDDETRAMIEDLLFEKWLSERRSEATIQWHWV